MTEVKNFYDKFKSFVKNHPIIWNLILIFLVFLIIVYAVLFYLDFFTEHGKYRVVPTIKNMPLNKAVSIIESEGFTYQVADSIYDTSIPGGEVVEQYPKGDSKVKSVQTIYLTINAFAPRMVAFPGVVDMSLRQAQSMLSGLGFKNVRTETIASPFKDLVIDAKVNGLSIQAGSRVPLTIAITLYVGSGMRMPDSVDVYDALGDEIEEF